MLRAPGELPESAWTQTLAEVEQAVGDCLQSLQRYEQTFQHVLQQAGYQPNPRSESFLETDEAWHTRLAEAEQHAHAVEQLLAEQEQVWNTWQSAYGAWWQSLEQAPV